jgi:uncharacterized protein (DUF488 family)
MSNPFFTIGHSTRSITAFVELLRESDVRLVVDVRTVPRSRTNPQFNRDALPESLGDRQIGYQHLLALGGLRSVQRGVSSATNGFWEHPSFHNFADYAMSGEFRSGFEQLRALGASSRVAIMCAESLWWKCHRRIIADYLIAAGEDVRHILSPGHIEPARLTAAARVHPDGQLTYPSEGLGRLDV